MAGWCRNDALRRCSLSRLGDQMDQVIVFDLDDTLYLEKDFAFSGFDAVGMWMASHHNVSNFSMHCKNLFESGIQKNIFNRALSDLNITFSSELIQSLIKTYRTHKPKITLAQDAKEYLKTTQKHKKIGLITDGYEETQNNKIDALDLRKTIQWIIPTGQWGKDFWKPHPRAFKEIESLSHAKPHQITYVADNALKDFVTPKKRGWLTVQILRPDRVHKHFAPSTEYEAHRIIESLSELDD